MKQPIILLVTGLLLISCWQGVAQRELDIYCDKPGYAIYIDGEHMGFTSNLLSDQEGVEIRGDSIDTPESFIETSFRLPRGTHTIKLAGLDDEGKTFFFGERTVDLQWRAEVKVRAEGERIFPRSDGFYIGCYSVYRNKIFNNKIRKRKCVILYMGEDVGVRHLGRWSPSAYWTHVELRGSGGVGRDVIAFVRNNVVNIDKRRNRSLRGQEGRTKYANLLFKDSSAVIFTHYLIREGYRNNMDMSPYTPYEFEWYGTISEDGKSFEIELDEWSYSDDQPVPRYVDVNLFGNPVKFHFVPFEEDRGF